MNWIFEGRFKHCLHWNSGGLPVKMKMKAHYPRERPHKKKIACFQKKESVSETFVKDERDRNEFRNPDDLK